MSAQHMTNTWEAPLDELVENYARLAVLKGVALQQGQELVVMSPVECADFARRVVRLAYEYGAGHVTMIWSDEVVSRQEYEHMDVDYFSETPSWKREQLNSLAEAGAAFLFVEGEDPEAFRGIDPKKMAAAVRARNTQCASYREGLDFGRNMWSIVGVPVSAWARKVFPNDTEEMALDKLWKAILSTARADGPDPMAAWDEHLVSFARHKQFLADCSFDRLHYTSSNGTDLTIGMCPGHIWEGGASKAADGRAFLPNIPTEEIYTSPDRMRVDGIVKSVLPLVHAGNIVDDFWMRFEAGRVVECEAARGEDVLRSIITNDENSCRLGECALVAKDTPIRQSGLLFYNTLYDENASCHLALGTGFPECIEGGFDMDKETLIAHGVNQSATHVDFMIGADDLRIEGITKDGRTIAVFEDGCWATDAS